MDFLQCYLQRREEESKTNDPRYSMIANRISKKAVIYLQLHLMNLSSQLDEIRSACMTKKHRHIL
jgi:hypothetical protein